MYSYILSDLYSVQIVFDLLIGTILLLRLVNHFGFKNSKGWIFKLLISAFAGSVADILCVSFQGYLSNTAFYISNAVFFVAVLLATLFIFNYIIHVLRPDSPLPQWIMYLEGISVVSGVFLIVVSYWKHWVYYISDDGLFVRGPFYIEFYMICCSYILASVITSIVDLFSGKGHSKIPIHPVFYAIAILIGTLAQVFIPYVPFSNMGLCISFMLIFINNQTATNNYESEQAHKALLEALADVESEKQKAEEANKAKTNFLFNMSHDIRTPMNAIMGYNKFIKKEIDNPRKVLEYQEKIEIASELLLSLINNVLDMARIESGKVEIEEKNLHTGNIVGELLTVLAPKIQEKNLSITHSVNTTHKDIVCDTTKVREIFLNLLSNAIKYTNDGGSIIIKTEELPCDIPGYVRISTSIADTGIGMSQDFLPTIFDAFTRERTTTDSKIMGTGLGMAIIKKLVDLMGGTITVESELGKGSCFTVTLTHRIVTESEKQAETEEYNSINTECFVGKKILMAEDNQLNAEIAKTILEDMGIIVDWVQDGLQCISALEAAEPGHYDLILMDIQMPNMNGYEATAKIRQGAIPGKCDIPIIAMTANAFDEDRKNAISVGMNNHISKPINDIALQITLAEYLK